MRYINRRRFLQGLGAATALAPFVPLLDARGQSTAYPKRLLLFYTPHATHYAKWTPTGTQTQFTMGPILAPLAAHQAKLNVLYGLNMLPPPQIGGHTAGATQLWTGSVQPGYFGPAPDYNQIYGPNDGPSIDQVIAQSVGNTTAYRSLQFTTSDQTIIFSAPGQKVYGASDMQASFSRLFGQVNPANVASQTSVLDVVSAQLKTLQSKVGSADKQKIAAHLQATGDLEKRLTLQQAACHGPTLSSATTDPANFASMIDLSSAAFACDLTRVISIQFGQPNVDGTDYGFLGVTGGHHAMTHQFQTTDPQGDTTDENNQTVTDFNKSVNGQLTKIYTWYSTMFARLLDNLDAVPEGTGTMLDNTLVIWGSELGDYWSHDFSPMPFVIAGGGNMGLQTGRFLDYSANPQIHNRLLVSMFHLMGLTNVNTFGDMDTGSGPLTLL